MEISSWCFQLFKGSALRNLKRFSAGSTRVPVDISCPGTTRALYLAGSNPVASLQV